MARGEDITSHVPQVSFLDLRCGDRPIDLEPKFNPQHYPYIATMDYSMNSFAVDAVASPGMEIVGLSGLQTTQLVSPGATVPVDIRVRDPVNKNEMQYTVTVTRLDGTDVSVRALGLLGSPLPTITPMFEYDRYTYTVCMEPTVDHIRLQLVPWDSGQTFEVLSLPEDKPAGTCQATAPVATTTIAASQAATPAQVPSSLLPQSPVATGSRRLDALSDPPTGETQAEVIAKRFPIDVGESRLIQIRVGPANGDQSRHRVYKLHAHRAVCPPHVPFYAPDLKQCAETCNEGYFRATDAARCEACAPLCLKCSAWNQCQVCQPSEWRTLYIVRLSGGFCQRVQIPWGPIIGGGAGAVIVLSVCCCLLRGPDTKSRPGKAVSSRGRAMKVMDSDNEYDMYDAE